MENILEEYGNVLVEIILIMVMVKILSWLLTVIEALPA